MAAADLDADVVLAVLDDGRRGAFHGGPVVGVEEFLENVVSDEFVAVLAEQVSDGRALVQADPVGREHADEILGVLDERAELALAAAGGGLGKLAFQDVLTQGAVEHRQFGSAVLHAVFQFVAGTLQGLLGGLARGDVLERPLVTHHRAVRAADGAGVFGDPEARAVRAVNLRLPAREFTLDLHAGLELRAALRLDVQAARVAQDVHQRLRRFVAHQTGEGGIGAQQTTAGQTLVDAFDRVLEDAAVAAFGVGQFGRAFADPCFQFGLLTERGVVTLKFAQHEVGEVRERPDVGRCKLARVVVKHAKHARRWSAVQAVQGNGGASQETRHVPHECTPRKARIPVNVRHEEGGGFTQRCFVKDRTAFRRQRVETMRAPDPHRIVAVVRQRNDDRRHLERAGGEAQQAFQRRPRRRHRRDIMRRPREGSDGNRWRQGRHEGFPSSNSGANASGLFPKHLRNQW